MAVTIDGTNGITSPDFEPSSSTLPTNGLYLPSANTLGLATNGTGKAFLDSAGNLGLGVTPSAWSAGRAIEIGNVGDGISINYGYGLNLNRNAYYNGGFKYGNSGYASSYAQSSGQHIWYTAPSGTAGAAISFTQAMTLSAAGGLSVGTTSDAGAGNIWAVNSIYVGDGSVSNNAIARAAGTGTGFYFPAANTVGFTTNATERARIDSSGNLLVGTTSISDANQAGLCVYATFPKTVVELRQSGTSTHYAITFRNGNGLVGNISTSGSTTAYNTSSDQRLKEHIVDAPNALDSVNAIKVRSFDWKSDGSHVDYGYIAQELLEVVPEAVSVHEDPEQMMGVDFGKLTPRLVKAIQELTARLEALENK